MDQTTNALLTPVANPYIVLNKRGQPRIYPSIIEDAVTGKAWGTTNPLPTYLVDPLNIAKANAFARPGDSINALGATYGMFVASTQLLFNPATSLAEPARTPTIWKSALILNAGSTIIWAAVAGKKHRIMGWRATLVNGTTAAAASLMRLLDAAAATGIACQICGAAMAAVGTSSIIANESWQNGYLSAAVNTDWNIDLSTALAVAGVFVQIWGTEE